MGLLDFHGNGCGEGVFDCGTDRGDVRERDMVVAIDGNAGGDRSRQAGSRELLLLTVRAGRLLSYFACAYDDGPHLC